MLAIAFVLRNNFSSEIKEGFNLMDVTKAVVKHFEAKREEALVRYRLYTTNIVGIGDHSNIVEEAIKAAQDYEHANSCLEQVSAL